MKNLSVQSQLLDSWFIRLVEDHAVGSVGEVIHVDDVATGNHTLITTRPAASTPGRRALQIR